MRKIYFDTSAYVKLSSQVGGTEVADSLFKLAEDKRVKIVMSIWAVNETVAAIDRKHRRGEIRDHKRDLIFAIVLATVQGNFSKTKYDSIGKYVSKDESRTYAALNKAFRQ